MSYYNNHIEGVIIINTEIINDKEYREVTVRGRTKLIAKDGEAINPKRRRQKATIHYNPDGYPCYGGGVPIHLYVAHAWVEGYFEGAEVNHKDFNRNNYNADNTNKNDKKENQEEVELKNEENEENEIEENKPEEISKEHEQEEHPELQTSKQYKNIHSTFSNIVKNITWKNLL